MVLSFFQHRAVEGRIAENPFKRETTSDQSLLDEKPYEEQLRLKQNQVSRLAQGLELWTITEMPRGVCC